MARKGKPKRVRTSGTKVVDRKTNKRTQTKKTAKGRTSRGDTIRETESY